MLFSTKKHKPKPKTSIFEPQTKHSIQNNQQQTNTMSFAPTFLQLSTEFSEPFVIPNVSPTSPAFNPTVASPVTDNTIARDRSISIIELN